MKAAKYLILGTLLIGLAMALSITAENPLQTVEKGKVADFKIQITNTEADQQNILLSAESDLPVSLSEEVISLASGETKIVHLFAVTENAEQGLHLIKFNANGQIENLAVNVEEGNGILEINSIYDKIKVLQGETQELKFLIRNNGDEKLRNIVISGDIPESLSPQYPETFNLDAKAVKEISIKINVPKDYPTGEYDVRVFAGSGNTITKAETTIEVEGRKSLKDALDIQIMLPWEPVKENGKVIGYKITAKVRNRLISDLSNVEWKFEGMPETWEVSGNEPFTIKGYETKYVELTIIPDSFAEKQVNITLEKDGEVITSQTITFAGYKVGAPTGLVIAGGSTLIGAVVVIALIIALLYVRAKNAEKDQKEIEETKTYLEKIVSKISGEAKSKTKKK